MCCAMLLSLVGAGLILAEVYYGGGRHLSDLTPAVYTMGLKMNTFSMPVYTVAIATVKVSVGCALMRIAGHTRWRYLIMTIMIIMGSWALSTIFVSPSYHERRSEQHLQYKTERMAETRSMSRPFPSNAILRAGAGTAQWMGSVGRRE